ncbi:hypothetical protein B7C42_01622 [Nocardia cerradoensis]|uniref:Uncharacterized protein n=1 Tax=Nocardia cerradoensis TaxID=85688 RepID=A0A231HD01_9NOCA|nr:hypothetical protein [Nocardia cerradoensis]OXR46648.1 hypothetical protein B7C42_01622 [Nocardia cerradoensis]
MTENAPAEHVCVMAWDFERCWSVCGICGRIEPDEALSRGTVTERQEPMRIRYVGPRDTIGHFFAGDPVSSTLDDGSPWCVLELEMTEAVRREFEATQIEETAR